MGGADKPALCDAAELTLKTATRNGGASRIKRITKLTSSLRLGIGILAVLAFSSCSDDHPADNSGEEKQASLSEAACSDSFVLSNKDNVKIYAEVESEYVPLATIPLENTVGAFLDCKREIVVAPYSFRDSGDSRFGIVFYGLESGSIEDLPFKDGMNSVVDHFRDGILVATGHIQQKKSDGTKRLNPDGSADAAGSLDNIFAYTHYIDLNKRTIADSFDFLMVEGSIVKDRFYGAGIEGLVVYNLDKKGVETQVRLQTSNDGGTSNQGVLKMPQRGQYFSSNTNFYYLPDASSFDFPGTDRNGKLVAFDRKTLYRLERGELKPYMEIPAFDAPSLVHIENEIGILEHDLSQFAVLSLSDKSLTLADLSGLSAQDLSVQSSVVAGNNLIVVVSESENPGDSMIVIYDISSGKVRDRLPIKGNSYIVTSTSDLSIF